MKFNYTIKKSWKKLTVTKHWEKEWSYFIKVHKAKVFKQEKHANIISFEKIVLEGSIEQRWKKRQKQQTNKNKPISSFTIEQRGCEYTTIPRRRYFFSFSIPVVLFSNTGHSLTLCLLNELFSFHMLLLFFSP